MLFNNDVQDHFRHKFNQLKNYNKSGDNEVIKVQKNKGEVDYELKMNCYHWSEMKPLYMGTESFKKVSDIPLYLLALLYYDFKPNFLK